MIRAHRIKAVSQDDASLISAWNITPNVGYSLTLLPGIAACGAVLLTEDGTLVASGAALTGTEQPCVLTPQGGFPLDMVDVELGWHLLITTTGTESHRTIRIQPTVDLQDEIHPIYADDALALVRATAGVDAAAHYIDDVTVSCPLGLGAGLGNIVSVAVDGAPVVGQVESILWTGTPDGTNAQSVIQRRISIEPSPFIEPEPVIPPMVGDDFGTTDAVTDVSGNVLDNDSFGLVLVAVGGLSVNIGMPVAGDNGGLFTINANGDWSFSPFGDFSLLSGAETAITAVTYHVSDGSSEAMGTLSITVSAPGAELWDLVHIAPDRNYDAAAASGLVLSGTGIVSFLDQSEFANHAVAVNSGDQQYVSGALNGNGAVLFNAVGQLNFNGTILSQTDYTCFFVVARSSADQFMFIGGTNSSPRSLLHIGWSNSTTFKAAHFADDVDLAFSSFSTVSPIIVAVRQRGNVREIWFNGALVKSSNTAGPLLRYNQACFGKLGVAGQQGYLFQAVLKVGALLDSDLHRVFGLLAHKWGMLFQLDANNPYKVDPPLFIVNPLPGVADPFEDGSCICYFPLKGDALEFSAKYTTTSTNVTHSASGATFGSGSTANHVAVSAKPTNNQPLYSISAWLRNDVAGFGAIFCENKTGWSAYGVEFYFNATTVRFTQVRSDAVASNNELSVSYSVDGLFHHYVGTRSGTRMRLYKDGELVAVGLMAVNSIASHQNAYIGQYINGNSNTPQGVKTLRDVRVFGRELNATEVRTLYNAES